MSGRLRLGVLAAALLAAGGALASADDAQRQWMVRTARMEGAAVNTREAADAAAETAHAIAASGRLHSMARLGGELDALNRRVVSAAMAAEVMDDD